jgi:hypothetical protein
VDAEQADTLIKLVQTRNNTHYSHEYTTPAEHYTVTAHPNNLYAYIGEEGSISLVEDKTGKQFAKFGREELQRLGISDATRMSDSDLQRLVQNTFRPPNITSVSFAIPSQQEVKHDRPPVLRAIRPAKPMLKKYKVENGFIGEHVEILHEAFSTSRSAVVRYARKNGTFKVQYSDGRFEWVESKQIIRHNRQQGQLGIIAKKNPTPTTTTVNHSKSKPTLAHTHDEHCSLCDKKIEDERPAFIVIRLPACRECSSSKALLIEDTLNLSAPSLLHCPLDSKGSQH